MQQWVTTPSVVHAAAVLLLCEITCTEAGAVAGVGGCIETVAQLIWLRRCAERWPHFVLATEDLSNLKAHRAGCLLAGCLCVAVMMFISNG